MNQKDIYFEYDITPDEMKNAMKFFDRKTKFIRRVAVTVILGFISAIYTYDWFIGSVDASFCMFVVGTCLGVIAVIWINSNNRWRALAKAVKEENKFAVKIDNEGIDTWSLLKPDPDYENNECNNLASENNCQESELNSNQEISCQSGKIPENATRLEFLKDNMKIYEVKNMFVVFIGKEWIYVFPYRCIGKEKIQELKELFGNKNISASPLPT